jgi:hypothetical protein
MEWVRRMDSILNRAEEIILEELVLAQCRPRTSVYLCGACTLRYLDILTYSNHQNSWQKFVGSNHARLRVVVGGRQSACILRLALRDFPSPPFSS